MSLKILILLIGTLLLAQQPAQKEAGTPKPAETIDSLKAENAKLVKQLADNQKLLDYWLRSAVECQVKVTNEQVIKQPEKQEKQQ